MKWKKGASEFLPEKTFLIIKDDLETLKGEARPRGKAKSSVSTGTWPPKAKKVPSLVEAERPKTANLDGPSILDPNLVDKLDMSLLSKELLCDSMTQIQRRGGRPLIGRNALTGRRRQSVPVGERHCSISTIGPVGEGTASSSGLLLLMRQKRQSFEPLTDSELSHVESAPEPSYMKKQPRLSLTNSNDGLTKRYSPEVKKLDDNNNKKNAHVVANKAPALSTLKKRNSKNITVTSDVEVFIGSAKSAPEPCKTCGRADQPERFHSHPKAVPVKVRDGIANAKPKVSLPKTVQKPVALNFRSGKSKAKDVVGRKTKTSLKREEPSGTMAPRPSPTRRGPKTVTCYICCREFGTASYPIHEPKCKQKWERENNALPPSKRRPAPQRPVVSVDHQDWNTAAWEQSQAQLIPCPKCGRTFLPDRLPIHQKSCKVTPKCPEPEAVKNTCNSLSRSGAPTIFCQICGRNFGSNSIKIHESQCLKRWHAENNALPPSQRKREPPKREETFAPSAQENMTINSPKELPQKRTITCYICGRDFGSTSISIHEPQCLKKWHFENDKLPLNQRRKGPQKPDIVFTRDSVTGTTVVDHAATAEANWRSHLDQLVPCKRCGRTFNPDRVAVHERSCKENPDGDCDFIATFHRIWENHLNSLVPCRKCNRTFTEQALAKHEPHCNNFYTRSTCKVEKKKQDSN